MDPSCRPAARYDGDLPIPAQLLLAITEHRETNVRAGVGVYPMATAGTQPPGKADIPQSRAEQLPGYKNNASLDMLPIPGQGTPTKSS